MTGSVTGTAPTGEDDYYLYVPAGGSIMVSFAEVGAHSFDVAVDLYNPSGTLETGTFDPYYGSIQYNYMVTAGNWKIAVTHWGGGMTGGNYWLTAMSLPGAVSVSGGNAGGQMVYGASYSGSNTRGQVDTYTFNGISGAGKSVTFTVTRTGTWSPEIYVYSPSGAELGGTYGASNLSYTQSTAAASGIYTVLIFRSYYLDNTGGYTLSGSGTGMGIPPQGKRDGTTTCVACEVAKKAATAGEGPPPQSAEVTSNGAAATPPTP